MAVTFVILLSCLASVILAGGPSSSYLPPVGGQHAVHSAPAVAPAIGRHVVSGHGVSGSTISAPSVSHLSPVHRVGRRPSAVGHGHVAAAPVASAHRPILTGIPSSVGVGRPHSYRTAAARPAVGASSVHRPTVIGHPSNVGGGRAIVHGPSVARPAASAPIGRRHSYAGVAAGHIPSAGAGLTRPHPASRHHGGHKVVSGYGSRTVGSKAPY